MKQILKSLPLVKAAHLDLIKNQIFKKFPNHFLCLLVTCLNAPSVVELLGTGLCHANLSAKYPSDGSNHRPISFLSTPCTVGKVLVKMCINISSTYYVYTITTSQSGFFRGDSTVNQTVDIQYFFMQNPRRGKGTSCYILRYKSSI